jgi:eukaryotic-like serine/threonine-protein kinase
MVLPSEFPPRRRPGGKEEIRASVLRTYVLRLRAEEGEAGVLDWLRAADVDEDALQGETTWLSVAATKRALAGLNAKWGRGGLVSRGEWAVHPDALGAWVRLLREVKAPIDAYRYVAAHPGEVSRVGSWALAEKSARGRAAESEASLVYTPDREDDDDADSADPEGEDLLCAVRQGELASFPCIWGLGEAKVDHPECAARGDAACVYNMSWPTTTGGHRGALGLGAAAASGCGGIVGLTGGWVAGAVAAGLGGALGVAVGVAVGVLRDQQRRERGERAFERHRIMALERGLAQRGDTAGAPTDLTGTVLGGKFRIGKKIGSGGIGVVYVAEHVTLGHEVAIKVLRGAAARDAGEIARLRREAMIQVHVDHPNVARVLDLDQMSDGSIYVVMERLVGQPLSERLSQDGLLPPGVAVPTFIDVARGLAAAHAKGAVHRDLKPANIFLCSDGVAKVLDFGMSKLANVESLTQAGYTLGTPEYMAPEQCTGAPVDGRSDIYACGVLMYEALTGDLPIKAKTRRELLDLHQRQVPPSLRAQRPDLPIDEQLDAVVMLCLRKKMNARPASASELEQLLMAIPREQLPTSYPPGVSRKPPKAPEATVRQLPSRR